MSSSAAETRSLRSFLLSPQYRSDISCELSQPMPRSDWANAIANLSLYFKNLIIEYNPKNSHFLRCKTHFFNEKNKFIVGIYINSLTAKLNYIQDFRICSLHIGPDSSNKQSPSKKTYIKSYFLG